MKRLDRAIGKALREEAESSPYREPDPGELALALRSPFKARPRQAILLVAALLSLYAAALALSLAPRFAPGASMGGRTFSERLGLSLPDDPEAAIFSFIEYQRGLP